MNSNRVSDEQKTIIALQYDGANAPQVSVNGTGLAVENILRLAHKHGILLQEDDSLARALACKPLGEVISKRFIWSLPKCLHLFMPLMKCTQTRRAYK